MGITTVILASGQNLGFAIGASTVQRVVHQFMTQGRALHPWIGIAGQTEVIDPAMAKILDLPARHGVTVIEVVPGGPAAQAGLEPLDLIVMVESKQVTSISVLKKLLRGFQPGDWVTLGIIRKGALQQVPLQVAELPRASRGSGRG